MKLKYKKFKANVSYDNEAGYYSGYLVDQPEVTFAGADKQELEQEFHFIVNNLLNHGRFSKD